MRRSGTLNKVIVYLFLFGIFIFLLAPQLVIIIVSFSPSNVLEFPPSSFSLRWYQAVLQNKPLLKSLMLSIRVGAISTVLALLIGTMAAYGLSRFVLRGKNVLQSLFTAPLIVPYVILALGLTMVFRHIGLRGTVTSIVLAHTVIGLPYVVLLVGQGFFLMKKSITEAAKTLGATELRTFFQITLPALKSNLGVAAFFVFITSFDDAVIAYFLAGPRTQTLTVRIWGMLREGLDPSIAAIATLWLLIILLASVFYTRYYTRQIAGSGK